MKISGSFVLLLGLVFSPTALLANDDGAELWLNLSVSFDLDNDTGIEIETAQRFRSAGDGRQDTYFVRLWMNQKVAKNANLSGAIERRINDGGSNEARLIQQLSISHGVVRTRLRLEQRFVDNANRAGLRIRPRIGVSLPIDADKKWKFQTDAEFFLTLRSTSFGGDHGLTGLRTQTGVSYKISDHLALSSNYLRQQDFNGDGSDRVGHAPIIGIEFSF